MGFEAGRVCALEAAFLASKLSLWQGLTVLPELVLVQERQLPEGLVTRRAVERLSNGNCGGTKIEIIIRQETQLEIVG